MCLKKEKQNLEEKYGGKIYCSIVFVPNHAFGDHRMDEIVNFVEQCTEAEIVMEEREIR